MSLHSPTSLSLRSGPAHLNPLQQNVDVDPAERARKVYVSFVLLAIWAAVEIPVVLLTLMWNLGNECDAPLKLWLGVMELRHVLFLGATYYQIKQGHTRPARMVGVAVNQFCSMGTLVWILAGQIWLFDSETCTNSAPGVFTISLALLVVFYGLLGLPVLALVLTCLCIPALYIIRRASGYTPPTAGSSQTRIDEIPTRIIGAATTGNGNDVENPDDSKEGSGSEECAVCMESFSAGDEVRVLPCNHEFHVACVDQWLRMRSTCPLCRSNITTAS
jgi:hypothetical protein